MIIKKRLFFVNTLLFVSTLLLGNSFAQDTPQWGLPEGVKARIGKGRANDIAVSSDGNQLAVATGFGVWVYNTRTGAEVALLTGHTEQVRSVAYAPDGNTLASASGQEVLFWNPRTREQKKTFQMEGGSPIAYSPNGQTLAVSRRREVHLFNARTGKHKFALGHTNNIGLLAFSHNSQTLATVAAYGDESKEIRLWNVQTGERKQPLVGHEREVRSIAFSPTANVLASGSWDGTVRLWNINTRQTTRTLQEYSDSLAYSPDGNTLAIGCHRGIVLLNANTGVAQRTLSGHSEGVSSLVFSSDGSTLVSASWDGTIRFWNPGTAAHTLTIEGHFHFRGTALSPNGQTIASSTPNGIYLWNALTGKFRQTFEKGAHSDTLAYSPNGNMLAAARWDRTPQIQLLNARTGAVLRNLHWEGDTAGAIAFSPDNKIVVGGTYKGVIRVWNPQNVKSLRTLTGHKESVSSLAFSPTVNVLASGSRDGTVRLWNPQNGKLLRTIFVHRDGVRSLAFSPDGKTLAAGTWNEIQLWDPQNGQQQQILRGAGETLVYSADGSTLVGGGYRRIYVWNASNGQLQRMLLGSPEGMRSLAFSPDGNRLISYGWDATLLIWNMNALPKIRSEDVTRDGVVDVKDLVTVAEAYGLSVTAAMYPNPDVNADGVVNRQDILKVLAVLDAAPAAPSARPVLTAETLQYWIDRAKQFHNGDAAFESGIQVLEELLATLALQAEARPAETELLANYPNPFNPETWIPYTLAQASVVSVTIYDAQGIMVRTLVLGHQAAGYYTDTNRAAHWDGRNTLGEQVASGLYFYRLETDTTTLMRKMVILK